jgi:hypothetical protein
VRNAGRFFHTRLISYFFGFATWWTLIVPTSFFIYLRTRGLSEITSTTGTIFGIAFAAAVVTSMVAVIANYFGMWIYLFACDDTGGGYKTLWAGLFFFTGPLATIPYFFLVYKNQLAAYPRA